MSKKDITVIEDTDPLLKFTCKVDGVAVVLTGATIAFKVYASKASDDSPTWQRTTAAADGVEILDQTANPGRVDVRLRRADLATPGKYLYRLDVTDTGDFKTTFSYGAFKVEDI